MENEPKAIERKDTAKEKIILFVIGVLVGAVISTAAFFVYTKTLGTGSSNGGQQSSMQGGGTPPEMPSGENGQGGTPPEMPSNNSSDDTSN